MQYRYRRNLNEVISQYEYVNDLNMAPRPQATKKWRKIVVDIVTELIIIGGLAWFIFSMAM